MDPGLGAMKVSALHSQSKQRERVKKAIERRAEEMSRHEKRCVVNKCAM